MPRTFGVQSGHAPLVLELLRDNGYQVELVKSDEYEWEVTHEDDLITELSLVRATHHDELWITAGEHPEVTTKAVRLPGDDDFTTVEIVRERVIDLEHPVLPENWAEWLDHNDQRIFEEYTTDDGEAIPEC